MADSAADAISISTNVVAVGSQVTSEVIVPTLFDCNVPYVIKVGVTRPRLPSTGAEAPYARFAKGGVVVKSDARVPMSVIPPVSGGCSNTILGCRMPSQSLKRTRKR